MFKAFKKALAKPESFFFVFILTEKIEKSRTFRMILPIKLK